jgi:glycosyltransferase involved in cell wall biosynthesis
MRSMGRRAEASMLPAVDTFITASPFYADYFRKVYHRDHIEVMLNCPPLQSSTPVPGIDFHAFYDWPKTDAIALYQGVLNKGRGLELLIEAIAHADPTLKLVILGNGTLEPHLKALVERLHLNERIKFFGQVPHEKLLNHTVAADFGVNLLDGFNLSKQLSSTNKLYEYMHAGIPILASQAAENQRVFAEFDIGVLCDNHPPAIAAAMSQIMHSPQKEQWRHNARLATQKYNWEQQSQVLRRVLE